jgi:peptidoglycan/xylan/chitin deacetylase (PgdA/CDA1 family)
MLAMVAADRFEIGSHTRTHAELTRLSDDDLGSEIDESIHDLERLGLPAPRFLAYPFGDHDERVRAAARHYLGAFTVDPGLVVPGIDPLRIPRISVRSGTTPERLVRQARALRWKARRRALKDVVSGPTRRRRSTSDGAPGGRPTSSGRASPAPR